MWLCKSVGEKFAVLIFRDVAIEMSTAKVFSGWNGVCWRKTFAEIAQLVEQRPEKPCVASSILALGTFFLNF